MIRSNFRTHNDSILSGESCTTYFRTNTNFSSSNKTSGTIGTATATAIDNTTNSTFAIANTATACWRYQKRYFT
jgi:hypothetical protein